MQAYVGVLRLHRATCDNMETNLPQARMSRRESNVKIENSVLELQTRLRQLIDGSFAGDYADVGEDWDATEAAEEDEEILNHTSPPATRYLSWE